MKTKEEIIEPFIWKDNSGNPRIAIMDCLNAMEIYANQFKQSHIQVVMQAEGSDGVKEAAVGKEREAQSQRVAVYQIVIEGNRQTVYKNGKLIEPMSDEAKIWTQLHLKAGKSSEEAL